ncbi:glycerophosphodiester phosphodiesterase GDPDL7-like [Zingiber officinale]|nr:glycerophosphodiester phosphodiesterase GDPDL7-like [Zingiber officinale]
MHEANISVHLSVLRNEYLAIAFDYFSHSIVEIATLVAGSPCSDVNAKLAYQILPIELGAHIALVPPEALPPAEAPAPALQVSDIQDPALPPVADL